MEGNKATSSQRKIQHTAKTKNLRAHEKILLLLEVTKIVRKSLLKISKNTQTAVAQKATEALAILKGCPKRCSIKRLQKTLRLVQLRKHIMFFNRKRFCTFYHFKRFSEQELQKSW